MQYLLNIGFASVREALFADRDATLFLPYMIRTKAAASGGFVPIEFLGLGL
jgi:hypothetical protein